MGRSKLRLKRFKIDKFDRGFFPNKDFEEVPDGGSSDCKHVIWHKSSLRPFFGMDRINSSQVSQLRGNGIFELDVEGARKRVGVFGTKFYEELFGVWADRTGAITLTDAETSLCQFINHQQGSNKYLIGCNGVDAAFKWEGSGNASVLGGSPPIFGSLTKYRDTIFGSSQENVYFSDTGDPETWDLAKWVIPFERSVKRLQENGPKVAVMMEERIGSISGFDYLDFTAEEIELSHVGCVGRLSASKVLFGPNMVKAIATVSRDGIWLVDESFGAEKLLGGNYFEEFNQANLYKSTVAYDHTDRLLFVSLPRDSTENDYLIVIDMETGAFWPGPSIHSNKIRAMYSCRNDSGFEQVYFVDTNGYAFKFNKETKNYHTGTATEAIDCRWKSRKIDLEDVYQVREAELLAAASGNWGVTMSVGFGLTSDDGEETEINLSGDGDVLGSFILGASVLGGSNYAFEILESVGGFGRFLTVAFENSDIDETFNIKRAELLMKRRRMGSVDR